MKVSFSHNGTIHTLDAGAMLLALLSCIPDTQRATVIERAKNIEKSAITTPPQGIVIPQIKL